MEADAGDIQVQVGGGLQQLRRVRWVAPVLVAQAAARGRVIRSEQQQPCSENGHSVVRAAHDKPACWLAASANARR